MWNDFLFLITILIVVYSFYSVSSKYIRRINNISRTTEKLYKFKGQIILYPLVGMILLLINNNRVLGDYKYIERVRSFFMINNSNLKIIIATFSLIACAILLSDFIINIFLKPVMFEEGLLRGNGKFIEWEYIKSISSVKGFTKNKKYILVNTIDEEMIYLMVNNDECRIIKEIMFNKSGIVNKDIVTDYN